LKKVVIDASVALKWYLDDETEDGNALLLLNAFVNRSIDLFAPTLLEYEVINGLVVAQKRGRIPQAAVATAISAFQELRIPFEGIGGLAEQILFYCSKYARSAYDASYIALAEKTKADLITADLALYNTVSKDLPWVRLLGSHRS
jgi:predicted nucleic acid-binding protein